MAPEPAQDILNRLDQRYPSVKCALHHNSAWELLAATILAIRGNGGGGGWGCVVGAPVAHSFSSCALDGGILTDTSGLTVGGGATLTGFGSAPVVTLAGGTVTQSGGTLSTSSITGFGTVNGVTGAPTITASKGLLDLTGTVASGMVLQADSVPSSVLELGGTISTSTSFTYLNTGGVFSGTLQLDAGALVSFGANGVISGMHEATGIGTSPTDVLDLRSVAFSSGYSTDILGGNTIQLWSDVGHTSLLASFHLAAPVATGTFVDWQADSAGGTNLFLDDDPCYVAGTHILTATGERMVESLMQGDIVLTLADGDLSARPVKWIGHAAHRPHRTSAAGDRCADPDPARRVRRQHAAPRSSGIARSCGLRRRQADLRPPTGERHDDPPGEGPGRGGVFPRRTGLACDPAGRGPAGGELPQHRQPRLLHQLGRAVGAASRHDG